MTKLKRTLLCKEYDRNCVRPIARFGITLKQLEQLNQDCVKANLSVLEKIGRVQGLAEKLSVNVSHGITTEIESDIYDRRATFGRNELASVPIKSFLRLFVESLNDTTLITLVMSAFLSIIASCLEGSVSGYTEGIAILVGVLVVTCVTSGNNYSKQKQFRSLSAKSDHITAKALRDGREVLVHVHELLVGDIILLESGNKIPADAVILSSEDVKCNEDSLTGEPEDVIKSSSDPFLLSSCFLSSGQCRGIVIAVGKNCRWGKIKSSLMIKETSTPLMTKLDLLAKQIGYFGLLFSFAIMIAMTSLYFTSGKLQMQFTWTEYLLHVFLTGVTVLVVAVPEGLPLALTVSLSYSTQKMLRDNNLIRVLAACETMGNVTSICSDKTGTLTENTMIVTEAWILGHHLHQDCKAQDIRDSIGFKKLAINLSVNSTAYLQSSEQFQVQGSKTEGALLFWLQRHAKVDYLLLRRQNFSAQRGDRIFPFSSDAKTMSTIIKCSKGGWKLFCKGAAEVVLEMCTHIMDLDGHVTEITLPLRQKLRDYVQEIAEKGLRAISVGHRHLDQMIQDISKLENAPLECLVLDAFFGIENPLRVDVLESIEDCKRAGIMVRMVTGDNIHTARAIGKQCGILTENGIAITGREFAKLSDDEVDMILPRLQIIARSSPDDKLKLVMRLQERSEIVGVTGDGTNDAPALRAADVGMAMGITGTDLAKESCDIIIMDDNFLSIRNAVLWGRCVYDNIRKFLHFQLTVNLSALVITLFSAVIGEKPPLNSVMMLWINLIMDTMGALALGTESPKPCLLDRKPYRKNAALINRQMGRCIVVQAAFQLILMSILQAFGSKLLDYSQLSTACLDPAQDYRIQTLIFNTFVFCQVFNELNARYSQNDWKVWRGISQNPMFVAIITLMIVVQVALVEFGGEFVQTTGQSLGLWITSVSLAAISLPLGFFMRKYPIKEPPDSFVDTSV